MVAFSVRASRSGRHLLGVTCPADNRYAAEWCLFWPRRDRAIYLRSPCAFFDLLFFFLVALVFIDWRRRARVSECQTTQIFVPAASGALVLGLKAPVKETNAHRGLFRVAEAGAWSVGGAALLLGSRAAGKGSRFRNIPAFTLCLELSAFRSRDRSGALLTAPRALNMTREMIDIYYWPLDLQDPHGPITASPLDNMRGLEFYLHDIMHNTGGLDDHQTKGA